ncbi:MAG TPA: response regulator [Acidisarcina sp.]|nr:response regulator [Acidisarcina sp.]
MARILCVDDEPLARSLKLAILERAGHEVVLSHSSEDAILRLNRETFDAIVTDWKIGTQDGRSLLEAAKGGAGVPVVVVSGYVAEALRGYEPFADIYLEKPVDPDELLQILDALLRDRLGSGGNES